MHGNMARATQTEMRQPITITDQDILRSYPLKKYLKKSLKPSAVHYLGVTGFKLLLLLPPTDRTSAVYLLQPSIHFLSPLILRSGSQEPIPAILG